MGVIARIASLTSRQEAGHGTGIIDDEDGFKGAKDGVEVLGRGKAGHQNPGSGRLILAQTGIFPLF